MNHNKHPLLSLISASELYQRCFNEQHQLIVQPHVADVRRSNLMQQMAEVRKHLSAYVHFCNLITLAITSIDNATELLNVH